MYPVKDVDDEFDEMEQKLAARAKIASILNKKD